MYDHKSGVKLRKLTRTDLPQLLELKADSLLTTHHTTIINIEDQNRWFDQITTSKNDMVLIASAPLGDYSRFDFGVFKIWSIDWINRTAEIAYDVYQRHRGHGYGSMLVKAGVDFCFECLNLNRLGAEVIWYNSASRHILKTLGFREEGEKRQAVFKRGDYHASIMYGMTTEDFRWARQMALLCSQRALDAPSTS